MPPFRRARCSTLVIAAAAIASLAASVPAWGASYGELARFSPKASIRETTDAFGVDPDGNSVYLASEEGGEESGKYLLQRIEMLPKGASKVVASESFTTPVEKEELLGEQAAVGIEGVAVHSAAERIYVLTRYERNICEEVDKLPFCPNDYVAAGLYAFSTKNGTLTPVGSEAGLIAGFSALKATSTAPAGALLNPQGIAIDPTKHEVVILGEVNEGTTGAPKKHVALWRVNEKGEVGSSPYISPKTIEEEARRQGEFDSPVVSASGKVFFQREGPADEIFSVPASFSSAKSPESVFSLAPISFPALRPTPFEQKVFEFGVSNADEDLGATLSLSPEGIAYSDAEINPYEVVGERVVEGTGAFEPGVVGFNYSDEQGRFSDLGWTGGREEPEGKKLCSIGFQGETYWMVAAGSAGKLFVLNNPSERKGEVIEFGPTPAGTEKEHTEAEECPEAGATKPRAEVGGKVVTSVTPANEVVLVSEATSNIKEVQWEFGDGTAVKKEAGEYQTAAVVHKFAKLGKLKVKETLETDDLAGIEKAGPKITKEVEINVEPAKPVAKFTTAPNGRTVTLNGSGSTDLNGEQIKAYKWEFGDGQSTTTTGPVIEHEYAGTGTYVATLIVEDAHLASLPFKLTVELPSSSPPPEETEHVASGPTTTPGGPPPGPPPPGGEVQHNKATGAIPNVTIASTSLKVAPTGAFPLKVSCPGGEPSCAGTITMRTLTAVSASVGTAAKAHKAVLTLASGSFTVTGGQAKTLTLHLSAKAKALLKRSHVLKARVTIAAHNPAGVSHTTTAVVTLRVAAKH